MRRRKTRAIKKALARENRPLTPKEIAVLTHLNHSTVRDYMRALLRKGVVLQPFFGHYTVAKPRHGVGESRPRVHNLRLSVAAQVPRRISKYVAIFGDVKIQVVFGGKRQKVTAIISSGRGMDYTACQFAIDKFQAVIKKNLNLQISMKDIQVTVCELNEDSMGIRLDGLTCMTARSFLGDLERIYNKAEGLRSEVRVQPGSVESIYALLKGGVTPYNIHQGLFIVTKKLDDLLTAQKFQNENLQRIYQLFKEFLSNHLFHLLPRSVRRKITEGE